MESGVNHRLVVTSLRDPVTMYFVITHISGSVCTDSIHSNLSYTRSLCVGTLRARVRAMPRSRFWRIIDITAYVATFLATTGCVHILFPNESLESVALVAMGVSAFVEVLLSSH
jgi:hypothetical protein